MRDELLRAKKLVESEPEESLRICSEILNEHNHDQDEEIALFMCGYLMMQAERSGLAYHLFNRCAQLQPKKSQIWSNMGMCVSEANSEEAIRLFKKAIKLDPENMSAIGNLALMYLQTGNPEECVNLCNRMLRKDPDSRPGKHNKGLAKLMLRDFSGWDEYFDTLGVKNRESRDYGLPEWNGEPGKVLVYGEQGVGDEIMFASCLDDLRKTNDIVLDCDSRLESIFKRTFPFPVYGTRYRSEIDWFESEKPDYQCAIGQLPKFYRRTEDSFPGVPYIMPDQERKKQWGVLLSDKPRIGIAWNGGLKSTLGKERSFDLDKLDSLLRLDAEFVNLEYRTVDDEEMKSRGIKNWPRAVLKGCDLEDTLALISNLDCVVTACTTVVYLAGSMGIPCYVWVPEYCGYRYHSFGSTFPWYNSVKLFRGKMEAITEHVKDIHRIRPKRDSSLPRIVSLDSKAG